MNICHIVGARPNFMKCIPLYLELEKAGVKQMIIHSGQHYDHNMSGIFFEEFGVEPDINLNISGAKSSPGWTIGNMLMEIERELQEIEPTDVVVYGDVNTTLAGALAAAKLNIPVHHVEAGLRSGDRSMPEEINRIAVDAICDHLYAPIARAWGNIYRDHPNSYIVGNIMIDCIKLVEKRIPKPKSKGHTLVTLHRPSNVDVSYRLKAITLGLKDFDKIIFPAHPRTKVDIETIDPVGYLEFLSLVKSAKLIITDSGGVQTEAAYFGVPCLVLRDTSEWYFSTLVQPDELDTIPREVELPDLWDGKTAQRIADIICG